MFESIFEEEGEQVFVPELGRDGKTEAGTIGDKSF
jgi:hypothetical protein